MTKDPYESGMIEKDVFTGRRAVIGELVASSDLMLESRGLQLIAPRSRAVLANEIHEQIITDEKDAGPGVTVNRTLLVGFFEVKTGGIIWVGDEIFIGNSAIGEIAGYDLTHMPNHMNIIVKAKKRVKPQAEVGAKITVAQRK